MSQLFTHKNYTIVAETYTTSNAWGHKATLYHNNYAIATNKIRYYNRTWESYEYQSVIRGLISSEIEKHYTKAITLYKQGTGKKRLTQEQKQHAINIYESKQLKELKEFYDKL